MNGGPAAARHDHTAAVTPDELLDSAELLRLMWDRSPVGFAVFDPRLVLRRFNRRYAELIERHGLGRAGPVTVGRSLVEYFPEGEDLFRRLADKVLAGETRIYRAVPHEQRGSMTHWDLVLTPLRRDQEVIGIVQVAIDATERAAAESELRRRDAILEAVRFAAQRFLESPTSWRVHIDEVMARLGRAAAVSRVYIFENFTGPDGSERTGQSHEWVATGISPQIDNIELAAMSYAEAGFGEAAASLAAGQVVAGAVAALPADARGVLEQQGILSLALVPVFCEGRWWGFIGFDECSRERTWSPSEIDALRAAASTLSAAVQRQRAEDRLREQQMQYLQVFQATGDGLVVTDLDGRLVRANPAFHRMHGYRPDELLGRHASTWIHPDHQPDRARYTAEVMAGGRPRRLAVDVRKDGSTFPVQVQGSAFTFQGRPHILGVVRDDTERAQAFELLEKRVSTLSEVAAGLTVNQALDDTLEVISRAVVAATPAIAGSALVTDPDTGRPTLMAACGLPDGYVDAVEQCWERSFNPDHPMLTNTEPLIVPDARVHLDDPNTAPLHEFLRDATWERVAVVPLTSRDSRLGSVNAYYPRGLEPSADDIAFLRAIADQGAVAVRNAQLVAEAQNQAGLTERQRLARELHDSVSQALYGITLGARTALALARDHPDQLDEPLEYVLSLAEAGMTEMRSLIFELRPESLAAEGLVAALERRVEVLRSRHRLIVDVDLGTEPDLPLPVKEALYRIAQEAMHNVEKHAHAERVRLRLALTTDEVELDVADDGVGFEPGAPAPGHFGLQTMRERAAAHQGTVRISGGPGRGTVVHARLTLPGRG